MIWFRILLGILGFVTFVYGIRSFHKDHYKSALVCLGFSAVFLLTDPTSFQGFLKTGIIAKLNSLGRTVDTIQDTLVEQQRSLSTQQREINMQQKELAEQQSRISSAQAAIAIQQNKAASHQDTLQAQGDEIGKMQKELLDAQEGIKNQQEKLSDIENLVVDIYDRTRIELFKMDKTNSMLYFKKQDEGQVLIFRLQDPPIRKSIQGMYGNTPLMPTSFKHYGNILATVWSKSATSTTNETYTITYVADPKGKKYTNIEKRDGTIFVDGLRMTEELMP